MMRILEIITPSTIGGAETHVVTLTRALQRAGDEVTIFCPQGRSLVELLRQQELPHVGWKTHGKLDVATLAGLVRLIRTLHIDVVHTHLSTASLLGSLAARLAQVPCVATVHGMSGARWYRFAHHVIAVSRAVKRHLVAQGLPDDRVSVLYNGILVPENLPQSPVQVKQAQGFDSRIPRVVLMGRLAPEKGQDLALHAWPRVLQRVPEARLILVGDGAARPHLQQLAADLGIAEHVDFWGFHPNPAPLLVSADLMVSPSRKEGLGLAVLEMMALGRPVVAADVDGLAEVVCHGETGLLVPRETPDALADAVCSLLADPARAAAMGRAGRKRVDIFFNITRQTADFRTRLAHLCRTKMHAFPAHIDNR